MLGECDRKLEGLGYPLDRVPAVGAIYKPVVIDGTALYTSGSVPLDGDVLVAAGKVPSVISMEDAHRAAALCAANILRNVRRHVGSLDRIERSVAHPSDTSTAIPVLTSSIWSSTVRPNCFAKSLATTASAPAPRLEWRVCHLGRVSRSISFSN